MSYSSLEEYYKTLWTLTFGHSYSVSDIENMIPFERDYVIELIADHNKKIEEEKSKAMF